MDFHSLTRKELQTLCKKNKIPANITNVAMADALTALQHVEGLEELPNQSKFDPQQSPEKSMTVPDIPRTACRTSTRRKPIKEEPESSQPLTRTRCGTRVRVVEVVDQERNEVPKTPAVPSNRRRTPAASARQKEGSAVHGVYSTRRSVRLLGKNMEKLSLMEDAKHEPLKIDQLTKDIFSGSERSDGSSFEKEACSEKNDDMEVSSQLKTNGSQEIQSDVKDDVQENHEDLESESHIKPEVLPADSDVMVEECKEGAGESDVHLLVKSDKIMDVEDETIEQKQKGPDDEITKFSTEVQISREELKLDNIMALKEEQALETEHCLTAKIANDVSVGVTNQVVAARTSVLQEDKSSSDDQTENLDDEFQNQSCTDLDANNTEGYNHVNADSEPEPAAEMESGEVKSLVTAEESAKCKGLTLSFSGGQSHNILNLEASGLNVTENDYDGKFDFEAESSTEEETNDESSEGESSDDRSEDDDTSEGESSEDDSSEEELSGDEASDDENETVLKRDVVSPTLSTDSELLPEPNTDGLVDVEVIEEDDISASFHPSLDEMPRLTEQVPCQDENPMMQQLSNSGPLVDVYVSDKMSPCHHIASSGKLSGEFAFSPDKPSGQFPRPTLSTSRKSPTPIIRDDALDDDNKDDTEKGSQTVKEVEVKKNKDVSLGDISLRQLQKMLKHKLQIENNNKDNTNDQNVAKVSYIVAKKIEKTRTALQALPENRLATDGHVNNAL
ncbi:hypothetical protein FEM48_Zijuj03G0196300 [Ziziphus jujuba var. spinosa]|uniref:Uncharacterized protein n=1 Tax=Ziziphus jujuba var. spinosa TaxID=714518 RepID=A0A978VS83_ZIZJJ|nr:hypothetical protein FEM48_Zijuj03G0196300 [Ziziphus jujuba var. spinosa]